MNGIAAPVGVFPYKWEIFYTNSVCAVGRYTPAMGPGCKFTYHVPENIANSLWHIAIASH